MIHHPNLFQVESNEDGVSRWNGWPLMWTVGTSLETWTLKQFYPYGILWTGHILVLLYVQCHVKTTVFTCIKDLKLQMRVVKVQKRARIVCWYSLLHNLLVDSDHGGNRDTCAQETIPILWRITLYYIVVCGAGPNNGKKYIVWRF